MKPFYMFMLENNLKGIYILMAMFYLRYKVWDFNYDPTYPQQDGTVKEVKNLGNE